MSITRSLGPVTRGALLAAGIALVLLVPTAGAATHAAAPPAPIWAGAQVTTPVAERAWPALHPSSVMRADPPSLVHPAAQVEPTTRMRSSGPRQGFTKAYITLYAAYDNDPAGSVEIAYPNERHPSAGGTGTYDDPLTLATDPRELPPGTLLYYPPLKRYYVMEDDCAECIDDWARSKRPHLDLWLSAANDARVLGCEEKLTPDELTTVQVNPPPGLPVQTGELYRPSACG